jgi:hypothetical protein
LLVIIALAVFWYGLVPIAGAFISRRSWRVFRRRFDELRLKPLLDYGAYRRGGDGELYRFIGGFESVTGEDTLWLRGGDLTVAAALGGAHTYMMMPTKDIPPEPGSIDQGRGAGPMDFSSGGEETPERIRWNRISALPGGVKVFVGGALVQKDGRPVFSSTREQPLLVIFYDGPDRAFPIRAIRAGRRHNEYWNSITPYSFILGAFSQIIMVMIFLPRPAFQLTALTAFIALFAPLFPLVPPGLLFTLIYQQLWRRARKLRSCRDLARLPLRHIPPGERTGRISGGEIYGALHRETLPPEFFERRIPLLAGVEGGGKKEGWYFFGALGEAQAEKAANLDPAGGPPALGCNTLPAEPRDVFAVYGALPGKPEVLAKRCTIRAYTLEAFAWGALLAGIGLNAFFIQMIVSLLF